MRPWRLALGSTISSTTSGSLTGRFRPLRKSRTTVYRRAMSLFDFWAGLPGDTRVHPADANVLARVRHGFDLRCLPAPWTGALRTAKVVLLFLAPGLDDAGFDVEHAVTEAGQEFYVQQRSGLAPMPSAAEHQPHWRWWTQKTKQFGITPEQARHSIAVLDMAPYHSKSFNDYHMLTALPSARRALDWAQGTLFPQAMAGERVVICLRSANLWGLQTGAKHGEALFAPRCARSGFMLHGEQRENLVARVGGMLA